MAKQYMTPKKKPRARSQNGMLRGSGERVIINTERFPYLYNF